MKNKLNNSACCHDLNIPDNTLVVMAKRTMVWPDSRSCFCSVCKKVFTFIRMEDKWVEK